MADDAKTASLANLPPIVQQALAVVAFIAGLSSLGLQFGQQEPPATQEEVEVLRAEVQELTKRVLELAFEIRLHHQEKD